MNGKGATQRADVDDPVRPTAVLVLVY